MMIQVPEIQREYTTSLGLTLRPARHSFPARSPAISTWGVPARHNACAEPRPITASAGRQDLGRKWRRFKIRPPWRLPAPARPRLISWSDPKATALLVLADGTVLEGFGVGAVGDAVGEVCFNTAMTGYQEILTDPSYAGQIVTFTFPHIGNVGTNDEDIETVNFGRASGGAASIVRADVTDPSNCALDARPRRLAEGARHRRPGRHRHPRADRADPRERHAERRHRPCARRRFRSRRR